MFMQSAFQKRISQLAKEASIKIAESRAGAARMDFRINGNLQPVLVCSAGNIWEFSCPSALVVDEATDFPLFVLGTALQINAQNKRGFWCIAEAADRKVLTYMHNASASALTPDEFANVCRAIVSEVEAFEQALLGVMRKAA